jgi:hypothetical protein
MTIKTWTLSAAGIDYGKTEIWTEDDGSIVYVNRLYSFVDADGNILEIIGLRNAQTAVLWSDVPQNIKDALIEIDTYTKNQINQQEGI